MTDAKLTDDDKLYCESIAKSIADVIRFSLNEEFRRKSCELFGVFSTKDTEIEISRRLMSMLEKENTGPKKKGKKSSEQKHKENTQEGNDTPTEQTDESSNTDCSSQTLSQCTSKTNWLQISSQRYRDTIKRKRLQFYSQPHSIEPTDKDFEFNTYNSRFSSSQPNSEGPSCSQFNEKMDTSCEVSDDGPNFCRKRFRESFGANSGKYLKSNLKYYKHIGF